MEEFKYTMLYFVKFQLEQQKRMDQLQLDIQKQMEIQE